LRLIHRLAVIATLAVAACLHPALAEGQQMPANMHTPASPTFFTVWGVFHVAISLIGTIFLLWLIRRGVEKL
jgi:hypothetical protein